MLKLKLQYFGHLMWRTDSFEKTLVLGKIEVGSKRGWVFIYSFSNSVQFSTSVMCNSLQPHGLQHTNLPCPSPTPRACSNSCPPNQWYHLILCHPLLLLPSIFLSIKVFSSESVLHIRWPKYWSFSFNINPSTNIQDWFPLGWTGWISLQSKGLLRVFSNTTVQKHQFFGAQLSL